MNNIAEEKPKYNAIGLIGGDDSTAKVHKGAMKLLDDYCHEMLMKQADITNENVKFHLATFADFLGKKKKVNGKYYNIYYILDYGSTISQCAILTSLKNPLD